jgi:hypothetical protein
MKTTMMTTLVLVLAMVVTGRAQPATQPAGGEEKAVLDAFRSYNDAMMALDSEGMTSRQHAVSDAEKNLSDAMVAGDLSVAKLKLAAEKAFGAEARSAVGRALGDISNDDLTGATAAIEGNRAVVSIPGSGSLPMAKVDGKWKFDMTQPEGAQAQLLATAERYRARASQIDALTAGIGASKFETVDELIAEARKLQ